MLLFLILLVLHSVLAHKHQRPENKIFYSEDDAQFHFESFLKTHNKIYESELEKATRFKIFKENLLKINEMNRKDPHATFAVNQFSDLSSEEFLGKNTGLRVDLAVSDGADACRSVFDVMLDPRVVPDTLDWRDNITMVVKDQQSCGSCYAFSATGNVEAQYAIKYNKSLLLSEQQILDCDTADYGCKGGWPAQALRFLVQVGGQVSEVDYPYINDVNTECDLFPDKIQVVVNDCINFRLSSEDMVRQALVIYGPLVTVIDAESIQSYESGILSNCLFIRYNHAVLIAGYGTENGKDYWLVKNSWGKTYGENGYFKIARDVNACGILNTYTATSLID